VSSGTLQSKPGKNPFINCNFKDGGYRNPVAFFASVLLSGSSNILNEKQMNQYQPEMTVQSTSLKNNDFIGFQAWPFWLKLRNQVAYSLKL
jgi:hypothetical protein